ncbi:FKBP-type peptidyl-prolyl cis-trans isomerase [Mucilaginibacter galii]|nr:FKBP-type peptidyl-prolyl cis-trans isomerase [Mucilaginibacter galii]
MNRLLLLCWCLLLFTACSKVDDPAVVNPDQAAIDDKLLADYVAGNGLAGKAVKVKVGTQDTVGVYYVVEKQGTVNTLYSLSSNITVAYTGKVLTTGEVIAEVGATGVHPAFVLGQTIKGWQLGLLNGKVNKGGIIRILMASRYAYGPFAQPQLGKNGLPPNSVLDFTIQIFDVTN